MNIHEQLQRLSENNEKKSLVQRYLLDCAKSHMRHRSQGTLVKALVTAKKCIKGCESWKKLYDLLWYLEAEAFEIDHYICGVTSYWPKISIHTRRDLVKVRLEKKFNHIESLIYLRDLAYFIDSIFRYISFPESQIPDVLFERFMCKNLFRKYFLAKA